MKARLIIQNFGPINNLDIEISKFNILIGPQGSGKSTISKVLCVIHSYFEELLQNKDIVRYMNDTPIVSPINNIENSKFRRILASYRIENFLKKK